MRCYAVYLKPRLVNAVSLFLFYLSKWLIVVVCVVTIFLEASTGVSVQIKFASGISNFIIIEQGQLGTWFD